MNRHWPAFTEMLRCTLLGHLTNRLAMLLAGAFIPLWIGAAHLCASSRIVRFSLDAAGEPVVAQANHVGQVTNALGAVMMVSGFMTFMETFKAGEMDRRLLLAGYPRGQMLLAKVTAAALIAGALALYTTTLLYLTLPVQQLGPLLTAVFGAGLAYGGIGLLLGSLVRGELEGFFLVVMLSLLDSGLQNPVINVVDVDGRAALPLYGSNQSALTAAFTHLGPPGHALLPLSWWAAASALALLVFHLRTRSYYRPGTAAIPVQSDTATQSLPPVPG
ncbi:integral membrane protein [Streptomyces sp. NRRL F-5755]|uniref:ABC transporter permease n=1 Tax=Streptomyces sp. NRRL F-5755 TaxID=1519475 RepID=UPI0006C028FA|nr:ABC transporter permease [Streptomyces sp. NRRL F-5755]KOT87372.1 integral membrane protein [Streptomyces sp. NRRL F-5755]